MSSKTTKLGGHEACPGYRDDNGIWNTGFDCPRWGGADERYCCGDTTRRYCCPKPRSTVPPEVVQYIPIVIGISVTLFVLGAVLFVTCCFCPICPGYKKRQKRLQKAQQLQLQSQQQQTHDLPDIAVQASGQSMPEDRDPSPAPGSPVRYSPAIRPSCSIAHGTHAEILHCGCQWSPTLPRSPMADLDSIMKQLYGDNSANWNEVEPLKKYPVDKPPPYTEHDIHKLGGKGGGCQQQTCHDDDEPGTKTLGRRFKERKEQAAADTKVTRAISDPSQLCMKSFRPMMIRSGLGLDRDMRRDSGVLVEEGEAPIQSEHPPFRLHGRGGLHGESVLDRPGTIRYDSHGSLVVDPTTTEASIHVQEFDEHLCS